MITLKQRIAVKDGKVVIEVPKEFGSTVEASITPLKENQPEYSVLEEGSASVVKEPVAKYLSSELNERVIEISAENQPLKDLVALVEQGNDLVLTESGKAVARIVALRKRIVGLHEGSIWMSDDFDDPLPDEFWLGND